MTLFLFDNPELTVEEGACLNRLSKYTNLIPIYTKGDCMASDDIAEKKIEMMVYSNEHGIEWFNCKEVGLLMTSGVEER